VTQPEPNRIPSAGYQKNIILVSSKNYSRNNARLKIFLSKLIPLAHLRHASKKTTSRRSF